MNTACPAVKPSFGCDFLFVCLKSHQVPGCRLSAEEGELYAPWGGGPPNAGILRRAHPDDPLGLELPVVILGQGSERKVVYFYRSQMTGSLLGLWLSQHRTRQPHTFFNRKFRAPPR